MAAFGIGLCLPVLFACVVSMSVVQGRNLRRRHSHHSHPDYYLDLEDSIPRDLWRRLEDYPEYQDPFREQMERRELSRILDDLAENEEQIPLPRKHVYDERNYAESLRKDEPRRQANVVEDALRFVVRRNRRHNRNDQQVDVNSKIQKLNNEEREGMDQQHQHLQFHTSTTDGLRASKVSMISELEVKEAQNSSICNYTVQTIPIPPHRTNRMPKDLEHIRCNYIGSSCQTGYCCIETYKNIEVSYNNGTVKEKMKIYVGCVCALQDLNMTEYPQLRNYLND